MKRLWLSMPAALAAVWGVAQIGSTPPQLASFFPGGPALYLEARDFAALLADWNASPEKQAWLRSANYEVFSRSRLLLRLQDAQAEFASAAKIAPDMALVNAIAGRQSAIAIYDIGKLEFLYITRLPSASALATALWNARTSYEGRSTAGKEYFVRTDASGRVAAFAATDDLLLLATREDLLAQALQLIAKPGQASLASDRWYEQARNAAAAPGELRLVLNMPALIASPHFRSYWIQRNTSQLRQYSAGIADLHRENSQWREDRVFLRDQPAPSRTAEEQDVARVVAWAPEDAVLQRAWAQPGTEAVLHLIQFKIAAPGIHAASPQRHAPPAVNIDSPEGSDYDLETRIDQPPLPSADQSAALPELRQALERNPALAVLHVQTSRRGPDGMFVHTDSAIALLGAADWQAAVPNARTEGRALIFASSGALRDAVAARVKNRPAPAQGIYSARYLHSAELPEYEAMMRMIDRSRTSAEDNTPPFFSGNVGSLGRVLARVQSQSVDIRDEGASVKHRIVYRLAR